MADEKTVPLTQPPRLRVWRSDEDWYIAETAEEALALAAKAYGADVEKYMEDVGIGSAEEEFVALRDDKTITVHLDDGRGTLTMTAVEWIADQKQQKGLLCSENY